MDKGSKVDILTAVLTGLWMFLTYGAISAYGPTPALIGGAVVVGVVGVMAIHGQYVTSLNIANVVTMNRKPPHESEGGDDDVAEERKKHR